MAYELFPTPTWPRPAFSIPFYVECKRFPLAGEMASRPLAAPAGCEAGAVTSLWASDSSNLFFVVDVPGQVNPTRERAWRYGDGLLLTLSPQAEANPLHYYTSLGLGGTSKKPQTVCVNRNGFWFPQLDCAKVKYRFQQEKEKARFSIIVPWSVLEPLRPLLYETIALNLTFVRRTKTGLVAFQLVADKDYDTEITNLRRLLPVQFALGDLGRPLAQSYLTRSCWRGDEPLQINLGLYNPETCPARLDFSVLDGTDVLESHSSKVELAQGSHHWTLKWSPQVPLPTGEYCLEISGSGCGKSYRKRHEVFVLNPQELSALRGDLLKLEEDINCLHPSAVHTALAKLEWLERALDNCPWQEPDLSSFSGAQQIRDALRKGENPLADKTGLSRRAFRSQVDGSLQAYSLYLPKGFTPSQKWPLLLLLHGSGVDEQEFAANPELHKLADRLGLALLFPRARTASGFYLGPDETDVMGSLAVLKKRLPLDWDRMFIGGFSMGGFGTWHIGLRHPGHFAGLAVISGVPCLPFGGENFGLNHSFNPVAYADNAKKLPLFVAHGAKDNAVPIEPVREIISQLREQGVNPVYKEYAGGGHGDYDWPSDLAAWLKTALTQARRVQGN